MCLLHNPPVQCLDDRVLLMLKPVDRPSKVIPLVQNLRVLFKQAHENLGNVIDHFFFVKVDHVLSQL